MIYLDYNATTPLVSQAKNAMLEAFEIFGNPSSVHHYGREARKLLEKSREKVAEFFNISPRSITFTSGATEANNTILKGFNGKIFIEATAHDSLIKAKNDITHIPVDENGIINIEALDKLLKTSPAPCLICIMLANNETGVIQPIDEILKIATAYKTHVHVDAVQAIKKLDFNYTKLPSFCISAHKFGGPKGIGALVINAPVSISSLIQGGGQERSMRSGTENIIGAVGMGAALHEHAFNWQDLQKLQLYLENSIKNITPHIVILGEKSPRLTNTSAFALKGIKSETQLMQFDIHKIAISTGSACSSGKVQKSHVLKAMNMPEEIIQSAIRISTGWNTTKNDIDTFINSWKNLYHKQNFVKELYA